MSTSERLTIPFKGLKEGKHEFTFDLTEKYFQMLDYSEFEKGNLKVKIEMDKKPTHLVFDIEIFGAVQVLCDRCLEFFDIDAEFSGNLFVKFFLEENENDISEELLILQPEDYEVDLTHYVYESICLSLPYQRIHPDDEKGKSTCNKAMIKKLKQLTKNDKNDIDPRWEKLKDINKN